MSVKPALGQCGFCIRPSDLLLAVQGQYPDQGVEDGGRTLRPTPQAFVLE